VVLPFYHPSEATTASRGDFVSSALARTAGFILNETLRGLNSACPRLPAAGLYSRRDISLID